MAVEELSGLIEEAQSLKRRPPEGRAPTNAARWSLEAKVPGGPADLYLYGDIGWPGIPAAAVVEQVRSVGARALRVHLNSGGGDVFDGLAIYNTLRQHPGAVEVRVEGLAGSIASVIAMAGSDLRMLPASLLMIHEPHGGVIGDAHDMRHMASLMDKAAAILADVYARRGADRAQIRQWMHDETWFSPATALQAGLIDAIEEAPAPEELSLLAASVDVSAFRNFPGAAAPAAPASRIPRARDHAHLLAKGFAHLIGAAA